MSLLQQIKDRYIFIILSNIVPLFLYFSQNWSVKNYLMYFWMESVIIGVFYLIKAAICKSRNSLSMYFFSILFYLFIHFIFLITLIQFGINSGKEFNYTFLFNLLNESYIYKWTSVILPILLIYLYDFIFNFLQNKRYLNENENPLSSMNGRAIVFIIILMPFTMFLSISNSPWVAILMIVVIRMLYDIDIRIGSANKKTLSVNNVAGYVVNFFLFLFSIMFINALFHNPRPIDLIASAVMFAYILSFKRMVK